MINSKYKVGDKVFVRPDLQDGQSYGRMIFVGAMTPYIGKAVTIRDVHECGTEDRYAYFIEGSICHWTNQMFGKVTQRKTTIEEKNKAVDISERFLGLMR